MGCTALGGEGIKPKQILHLVQLQELLRESFLVIAIIEVSDLCYSSHLCWLDFISILSYFTIDLSYEVSMCVCVLSCQSNNPWRWVADPVNHRALKLSHPLQMHPFTLDDAVSFLHLSQLPGYQVNTDDKC